MTTVVLTPSVGNAFVRATAIITNQQLGLFNSTLFITTVSNYLTPVVGNTRVSIDSLTGSLRRVPQLYAKNKSIGRVFWQGGVPLDRARTTKAAAVPLKNRVKSNTDTQRTNH
jgi:hypothetical protein